MGQLFFGLLTRGDVALNADVALRFAEAAAHGEYRKFDRSFLAVPRTADVLAGVVAGRDQLVEDLLKSFFTEVDCGSFAFEIVVSVTEQGEVRAVLLQVETVRIDDRDRFFRVCEDLLIETRVQLYGAGTRPRFSSRNFCRHGNARAKRKIEGGLPGESILTLIHRLRRLSG